jgi:hypothetical protein
MSKPLTVDFRSGNGTRLTQLKVFGDGELSSLNENGRYEYELDSPLYSLKEVSGVLSHSRISHNNERGLIEPGNYVGLLKLQLLDKTGAKAAETYVDVRSTKLGYEDEYRSMLEDIADRCADFLLHGDGQYQGGGRLFKIISEGPRVFSKQTLIEQGYPDEPSQPYYLVYDVEPLDAKDPLSGYDWDLSNVNGIGDGRNSPVPERGIPLSEFMKGAKPNT